VDALKRMLRGGGITYAALAQRLEEVCQAAGIDFAELVHAATGEQAGVTHLTVEQEQQIVSDPA